MTGLHTGHAYVRGNREHKPVGQEPIPESALTVAELLRSAGYATGAFGKWGLGYPGSTGDPVRQGFDEFFGYNCQRNAHTYYPRFLYYNDERVELDGKTYSYDLIMERALAFVRTNARRPFFCYLPVTIPHAAMHVPERYAAPFRSKFSQFEDVVGRYAGPNVKNPVAAFAGMLTKLDEDVGRLVRLLAELGIERDTLILFTSDNGPHKEGGHRPDFFDSNGPLRGIKRDLYEGGIRVPMIARWPGRIEAGSTSGHISAFWDFLPTCCELIDVEIPEGIDGISVLPTLLGKPGQQREHEYLYWEFHEQGKRQAVRMGVWKGIKQNIAKNPNGPIELYNLRNDIGEKDNVAIRHPEIVAKIEAYMKAARTPSEHWPLPGE
jgi:arylsulfatase A-like enzyme